jgi:peptidoglycan/LPS O-acetylase OafA/YrhL
MTEDIRGKRVSDHLDLFRGLAALAVLVYHVRYRFFFDYHDLTDRGPLAFAYYALTAFGHDAVMIFFVLSGFFISASVMRDTGAGRWSWRRYLTNRGARLYVVLLPGLLLTLFWDALGLHLFPGHGIYTGAARGYVNDFFSVPDRLTLPVFLGNVAFLQTIVVPPFGSNDPLWSLSFEWWYYLLFPCLWLALARPARPWQAVAYALVALALAWGVGKTIVLYFPIWLLGTLLCRLPRIPALRREFNMPLTVAPMALFTAFLFLTHAGPFKALVGNSVIIIDYCTAGGFFLLTYFLLHDEAPSRRGAYAKAATFVAGFSFTLYVSHMPLLVFLRAALVPATPWTPDLFHILAGVLLALGCLVYALGLSRVTEAYTDQVRDFLRGRLWRAKPLVSVDRSLTTQYGPTETTSLTASPSTESATSQ